MSEENKYIIDRQYTGRTQNNTGSCASSGNDFYIKIYTNGNIDIKQRGWNSCSGQGTDYGPMQDLLIINDNKKLPIYFIDILKHLLGINNTFNHDGLEYSSYYNMVIDIIKEYKTKHNNELTQENRKKLDELIIEHKLNNHKEKELIKEEKIKIAIVKEKLAQQKRDLDDDKFKFELEKDRINDFDIDKFIKQNNI